MSSPSTAGEVQGLCGYYARAGYFRHIQTACADFFKRKPAPEPALVFWRAFGAMREGSINESIADLNTLRREGELQYAVLFALAHAHNLSKVIDTDEVFRLEAALAKEAARAGERGLWLAAQFAWHVGRTDDALELADKLAALKPGAAVGQVLKCWLQLATGGAHDFAPAAWDECGGKNELDTLLGKAAHLEALGAPDKALDVLNQLIVLYGWFTPALAEKARLLAATNDWEQAVETAQRLLGLDGRSIDGLRLVALHALAYEGNAAKAAARIGELTEAVDRLEPKNPALCAALAKPLARVAGGNSAVLRLTQGLIDRACRLAPFATEHVLEKAYEHALAGDFKAAAAAFREANGLDASDMTAVLGQIRCQVEGGAFAAAQTQLEFAAELSEALGPTADLAYVSALVAARHRLDRVEAARHLDRAVELHRPALDGARRDAAAYAELRPDFLIEVAAEFLRLVDGDERGGVALEEGSAEAAAVAKATRLLELVRKLAPGLLAGQMLLARARYFLADLDGAVRMLAHCAKLDASYAPASLLHAQILLQQEQPKAAMAVLEAALAHDFTVRDSLLYNLVRARSLAADGEHADALEVLRGALRLPAVRDGLAPAHERCSVHLQTVDALLRLERNDDAGRAMGEAIALFAGTEQEGRITVANCELLLAKGDVTGAMSILRAVGQASPNYTRAKRMLADLYLTHRNDRRLFCECYEELARSAPSVSTLVALGEAYLSVQEPEKAIPAFERARERAPHDTALAVRIGRAHASTHDYLRAVEYYEGALARDPSQSALSLDFARLYHRLHKQELARGVLEGLLDGAAALGRGAAAEAAAAEASDDERGALELGREVAGWQLYAQVLKAQAEPERAVQAQLRAKQTQQRLVARTVADAPDALPEQRAALCAVGLTLAQLLVDARQSDRAVEEVEDALRQQPADAAATLALAKLHLQRGETDLCQRHCASLMRADTDNLEASLMLADLMLRKVGAARARSRVSLASRWPRARGVGVSARARAFSSPPHLRSSLAPLASAAARALVRPTTTRPSSTSSSCSRRRRPITLRCASSSSSSDTPAASPRPSPSSSARRRRTRARAPRSASTFAPGCSLATSTFRTRRSRTSTARARTASGARQRSARWQPSTSAPTR